MSVCVVTVPQVQLHGVDLFFWVAGQVATAVPIALLIGYFALRSISNLLYPESETK